MMHKKILMILFSLFWALPVSEILSEAEVLAQVDTAWVRRYNGPGNGGDYAGAIAVDSSGNICITGHSYGSGSNYDYATIKYSSSGDTAWVRRYNGTGNGYDEAHAITVDASGNVYVTGGSYGGSTGMDYATGKYYANGFTAWVRIYTGSANDWDVATAVAVDGSGYVYVTGGSTGNGTGVDYASIKLYPDASYIVWERRYNAANDWDEATAIAVDASGNVYVTGESYGYTTGYDYATIKYYSNGNTAWTRRYNGPGNQTDEAKALTIDGSGNVYVTGYSYGGSETSSDYATIKYSSNGGTAWVKRYNGPANGTDRAYAIAADGSGNVYVTGSSSSGTSSDYATIKYYPNGDTAWVRRYNGTGNSIDVATAIGIDSCGNTYVTGYSSNGTNYDYTTIKYDSSGNELWTKSYNGPGNGDDKAWDIAICGCDTVYVTGESYGYGTDYDYATIKYVQFPTGTIAGNVLDASTLVPIDNVLIEAIQESLVINSDYSEVDGSYGIPNLPAGLYNVRAQKPGYETKTYNDVEVVTDETTIQDFNLNPSPADTILYDDFSGKSADWGVEGPCTWFLQDGTFGASAEGNGVFCLATAGDPTWTDYIFEADVYGIAGVDKAIEFRVEDYSNHYQINLRSDWPNDGDDSLIFCKVVNLSCVDYHCEPYTSQNNTWYHLKVEAIGKRFRIYVDDNLVLQHVDEESPFLQGKIGLGCWTGDANTCNIRFDDVLVALRDFDFQPNPDGWKFANNGDNMWPKEWWEQFEDLSKAFPYNWIGCGPPGPDCQGPVCKPAETFPDWPLWVDVFGREQCYLPPQYLVPNPRAYRVWWDVSKCEGLPGWCFGFCLTASLYYDRLIVPGSSWNLYDLELTNGTRYLINSYHIHQYSKQFQHYQNLNDHKLPSQTLQEVRDMIDNFAGLRFLAIRGLDLNDYKFKCHVVVPWKIEPHPVDPDTQYIYVYDSGAPDISTLRIKIHTPTNWWWYIAGDMTLMHRNRGLFLSAPVRDFLNRPLMLDYEGDKLHQSLMPELNNYLQIYCTQNSDIRLTNSIGEEMGNAGDSLYSSFSDGTHIIPFGPFENRGIGFYVPKAHYQLNAAHTSAPLFYFDIFADSINFFYHREVADTTESDALHFSRQDKWIELVNLDQIDKLFSLETITAVADTYFIFGVDRCDLYFSDSLKFSPQDPYSLEISNKGASKTYTLRIERVTTDGDSVFVHHSIPLEDSCAHIVTPDWGNHYIDSVLIYIDYDLDGVIDDSLIVDNQSDVLAGDANGDGAIDVADVMYLINYLFIGGSAPDPLVAGDTNCDGIVDIADVMYLINYLFIGGSPPGC